MIIPWFVRRLDKVICISNATKEECLRRGVPERKIAVIPNGISDVFYLEEDKGGIRRRLEEAYGIELVGKKVLLSVGRLVERKGFHWFIEKVLPELVREDDSFYYILVGDGPLRKRIEDSIIEYGMSNYVFMTGGADNETLKLFYNSADILVMPNLPVEGDMEGFGVVALEASSCGVPVVASDIEGIRDSVIDGVNGYLVEANNLKVFKNCILTIYGGSNSKLNPRGFAISEFNWKKIANKYFERLDYGKR